MTTLVARVERGKCTFAEDGGDIHGLAETACLDLEITDDSRPRWTEGGKGSDSSPLGEGLLHHGFVGLEDWPFMASLAGLDSAGKRGAGEEHSVGFSTKGVICQVLDALVQRRSRTTSSAGIPR